MASHGDRPDLDPRANVLRHVLSAAARVGNTVRAALRRVARRFAPRGRAEPITSTWTSTCSTWVRQDEYRAGFSLTSTHRAVSDPHECPWCLSLGNPDVPDPDDPAGPRR